MRGRVRAVRVMARLAVVIGLVLAGCKAEPPEAPASPATTSTAPNQASTAGAPAPPAPSTHSALADGWVRAPVAEPEPAARGLYRRAIDLVHRGDPIGSKALVKRIREDWPASRFARRLARASDPAVGAAVVAALGGLAVAALARSGDGPEVPGPSPAASTPTPPAAAPSAPHQP